MPVTIEQLEHEKRIFQKRIERSCPDLLHSFPIARYTSRLRQADPYTQYEVFPPAITKSLSQIGDQYGREALALYHKIGLCMLMIEALQDPGSVKFPPAVHSYRMSWFQRIVEDISTQPDSYYDIDRPLWPLRKDIGVCSGRSVPVGSAWVVESRYLPRRALIRGASQRAVASERRHFRYSALRKNLCGSLLIQHARRIARHTGRKVLTWAGRYDRCYVIHTVERNIRDFGSRQMELAYRTIASLLAENENVWGVYRSSWFLDPAVAEISDELAFLSQVPVSFGAELYYGGPCSPNDVAKATLFSPERSRLFESGQYAPRNYFYFWERQALIDAFGDEESLGASATR